MTDRLFSRRSALTLLAASAASAVIPRAALAFGADDAARLIERAVAEITRIINSGKSETAMYRDFERFLTAYAHVSGIARSVLGPPARSANSSELSAFTTSFQNYIAEKYGARFREFIGGKIVVNSTHAVGKYFEVRCTSILKGEAPFEISFVVHAGSGKFIDLKIEGISLVATERAEIGAKLDRAGGSISKLARTL